MTDTNDDLVLVYVVEDDDLAHAGVKGMKWGVRKKPARSSRSDPNRRSTDRKAVDKIMENKKPALTNKQLKTANNRLQLEKTYSELTKQPGAIDRINKGNNNVKAILAIGGTAIAAYNMVNSPLGQKVTAAGANFIKNAFAQAGPQTFNGGFYAATVARAAIGR
jgi:hypothetical protein